MTVTSSFTDVEGSVPLLTTIGTPTWPPFLALGLPRRATPLSLGSLLMGLVNLFGGNLAAGAGGWGWGVTGLRTQDKFGGRGMGRCDPESMGLALNVFQDGSTGLPTGLGGLPSVTQPSNSVFPHPSTVHQSACGGLYPKPVWCCPTPISTGIGRTASDPFPVSEKSVCQNTRASEQGFRMHAGQWERSP